ncbi:uncharacterized protein LOC143288368 [Babylonia areolata]|uniref:uncharacterized protein LOC143288368 n=1 Tax=Babylonia areolata TaxID=304850 RepID=UPI003FD693EA
MGFSRLSSLQVSSRTSCPVEFYHSPCVCGPKIESLKTFLHVRKKTVEDLTSLSPGNVAVHAEHDVHIGQEVNICYNFSNVSYNNAEQITSCNKFISKQNVSPTSVGESQGFSNIRDQTQAELRPNELFVETSSYQQAVDAIAKEGLVLITGPPGSGKAEMARAVLHHYKGQGCTPLIFHEISEWRHHVGNRHHLIVLFEHVFGDVFFSCENFEKGARFFRSMLEFARSKRCLTVFTAYPHIAHKMKDYDIKDNIFRYIPVVSLHLSVLSIEEKKEMIRRHGLIRDVTEREDLCDHIITRDVSGSVFPGCLRKFMLKAENSMSIFSQPAFGYTSLLSRGLKDKTHGDCLAATLFLLIKASQESETLMDQAHECLKRCGFKVCRTQCVTSLMRSLWQLFGHVHKPRCIDSQMTLAAGITLNSSDFNEVFLQNCDLQFLMEFLGTDMLNKRSLKLDSFRRRIYDEILLGHHQEVCQLQLLQDEKYLQEFAQFCTSKRLPLHNLFSVTDSDHKESFLYWSAFCPSAVLTEWCVAHMLACGTEEELLSECLQRVLLVSVFSGDNPSDEKVRKIVSQMRKLPTVPVSPQKMILPFPKNAPHFGSKCEHLKKHGSFYLHFFLRDGFFPYEGVHVFINEVNAYFRLEMTEFHWSLVLRRVQAEHPIGLHGQDVDGNTFLHVAARHRNPEAVRFAVKSGASVTVRNKDGMSAPDLAAKRLQTSLTTTVNREVHDTCCDGNMVLLKKLLCLDATVSCTDRWGNTALHSACKAGQISIASLLLELGADINASNVEGFTPLTVACRCGHRKTTDFLLQQGADPNIVDAKGIAPLHCATYLNNRYIILLLLNSNADINVKTMDGDTPLHVASRGGNARTVKQLLEENAKMNVKNRQGMTPLHLAVKSTSIDTVHLLCHCGANMTLKDKSGLTPVATASMLKNGSIYALLLKYKAEGVVDPCTEYFFQDVDENGSAAVSRRRSEIRNVSFSNENCAFSNSAESGDDSVPFMQHGSSSVEASFSDNGSMFSPDAFNIRPAIFREGHAIPKQKRPVRRRKPFCSVATFIVFVFVIQLIFILFLILFEHLNPQDQPSNKHGTDITDKNSVN